MSEQAKQENLVVAGVQLPITSNEVFIEPALSTVLEAAEASLKDHEGAEGDTSSYPFRLAQYAVLGVTELAAVSNLLKSPEQTDQLLAAISDQRGSFWEVFDPSAAHKGLTTSSLEWAKQQLATDAPLDAVEIKDGQGNSITAGIRGFIEKVRLEGGRPYEMRQPELWVNVSGPGGGSAHSIILDYRAKLRGAERGVYASKLERWTLNWQSRESGHRHMRQLATLVPFYGSTGDWMRLVDREELIDGHSGDILTRTQYRVLTPATGVVRSDSAVYDRRVIDNMLND